MKLTQRSELREIINTVLYNWGLWCRVGNDPGLGFPHKAPMFRMYIAPRQEKTRVRMPIDEQGAVYANDAIIELGKHYGPDSDEYLCTLGRYVFRFSYGHLAKELGVSKGVARHATERGKDFFWPCYQQIVSNNHKKAE